MDEPWKTLGYDTFDAMQTALTTASDQVKAKETFIQTQATELGEARKRAQEAIQLKADLDALKQIQTPPTPPSPANTPPPAVVEPAPVVPTVEDRLAKVTAKYGDREQKALMDFVETLSPEDQTRIATEPEFKVELMEHLVSGEPALTGVAGLFPEFAKKEPKADIGADVKKLFAKEKRNANTVIPTVKSNANIGMTADKTDNSIAETAPIVPKNGSILEAIASKAQGTTA